MSTVYRINITALRLSPDVSPKPSTATTRLFFRTDAISKASAHPDYGFRLGQFLWIYDDSIHFSEHVRGKCWPAKLSKLRQFTFLAHEKFT